MRDFDFYLPTKIVFGPERISELAKHVRGLGKKALLVTGRHSQQQSGNLAKVQQLLSAANIETAIFEGIEPNPRTDTVDRAAKLARDFRPRFVVALGGGSVMDASKVIALLAVSPGSAWDYAYKGRQGTMLRPQKALPLVCLPTLAATGSESDPYAVVTNWATREKCTVFGAPLYPRLALIDPQLSLTVPWQETLYGGMDIITHALEAYLSSLDDPGLPATWALGIVKSVKGALEDLKNNPKDISARGQLSWASTVAINGFLAGQDGPWPLHAIEHAISAHLDIAHGWGLALLVPQIMLFNLPEGAAKIARLGQEIFAISEDLPEAEAATLTIDKLQEWLAGLGLEQYSAQGAAVPIQTVKQMAKDVIRLSGNHENTLANIKPMAQQDIELIIKKALD